MLWFKLKPTSSKVVIKQGQHNYGVQQCWRKDDVRPTCLPRLKKPLITIFIMPNENKF